MSLLRARPWMASRLSAPILSAPILSTPILSVPIRHCVFRPYSVNAEPPKQVRIEPWVDSEYLRERRKIREHAGKSAFLWVKITLLVCVPALIGSLILGWVKWQRHWEHWAHLPPLEDRIEYPYQNIRTKSFPFKDGDKSLFWNDKVNYHNKDKVR